MTFSEKILSLLIHPGYSSVELALADEHVIYQSIILDKREASSLLVLSIETLLLQHRLTLSDMAFLVGHQGPGPFTTLRVALASINGLAYATKKPLIGVDGFDAFIIEEKERTKTRYLVVLLNAFCEDVYYAIHDFQHKTTEKGCEPIGAFVRRLTALFSDAEVAGEYPKVTCVGNGVTMYRTLFENFGTKIVIPEQAPELCSIESVRICAYKKWHLQAISNQLLPHYLKNFSAQLGKTISEQSA